MLGIINRRPCDDVKVVASAPLVSAPCNAPAAPASDCISVTLTLFPKQFSLPAACHSSMFSAIGEDGVIG